MHAAVGQLLTRMTGRGYGSTPGKLWCCMMSEVKSVSRSTTTAGRTRGSLRINPRMPRQCWAKVAGGLSHGTAGHLAPTGLPAPRRTSAAAGEAPDERNAMRRCGLQVHKLVWLPAASVWAPGFHCSIRKQWCRAGVQRSRRGALARPGAHPLTPSTMAGCGVPSFMTNQLCCVALQGCGYGAAVTVPAAAAAGAWAPQLAAACRTCLPHPHYALHT